MDDQSPLTLQYNGILTTRMDVAKREIPTKKKKNSDRLGNAML
jgi:hypothetical protein